VVDLPSAVLFCCTSNSIRSPMAEALLKHYHGSRIFVDSCGVRGREVDGFAIAVMAEIGLDIQQHAAKTFDALEYTFFDEIVSLSPEAQHSAVEMTRTVDCEVVFWNTLDPSVVEGTRDQCLDAYREVRDTLARRILKRYPIHIMPRVG